MKHKIIKEIDIVYKKYKTKKAYDKEKYFYLTYQDEFDFIPNIIDFNDGENYIIYENVGERVDINDIDFKIINEYNEILMNEGIYHNDMRVDNILYNPETNKYFIIDFEYWDNIFKDNSHEKNVKRDIRLFLNNYN